MKAPFPYFPWAGSIEVREDGSIWRVRSQGKPCEPRRIDIPDQSKGYRNVVLPDETGRWRTYKAHRIVWWWHHGPIQDGLQVNHINLDKADNRLANLETLTASENIAHSYANGRTPPWSRSSVWRGRQMVTPNQIAGIQARRAEGITLKAISAEFGISITHTQRLIRKEVEGRCK